MKRALFAFAAVMLCAAPAAHAAAISPAFTSFGTLAAATFGGSGIPNTDVAITQLTNGGNTITLGLTATPRFANPALTDNNAGVFGATAGGDVLNGAPTLAKWNFDFYANTTGGNYTLKLLYDFNPAAGTDQSALGSVTSSLGATTVQDSWNLGMPFLSVAVPGIVPPAGSFNPNAAGEYSFALLVLDQAGVELGRSAILVNAVPEPVSLLLLGTGLAGVAIRRRRNQVTA